MDSTAGTVILHRVWALGTCTRTATSSLFLIRTRTSHGHGSLMLILIHPIMDKVCNEGEASLTLIMHDTNTIIVKIKMAMMKGAAHNQEDIRHGTS